MSGCCSKDEKTETKAGCREPSEVKAAAAKEAKPADEKTERGDKRGCGCRS